MKIVQSGLTLIYDKVSIAENNAISSASFRYKENINSLSLFQKISEESVVADLTSRSKKIYAKKPTTNKAQNINIENSLNEGFEVFVPKKALSDNRTYETFNWRLIAKINKQINISSINYGNEIDQEGNIKQKEIKCAVLCTSADLNSFRISGNFSGSNPYIFKRLSISDFNLSRYTFTNPLAPAGKSDTQAEYWLVDIDNVSTLEDFDVVAWSPTSPISSANGNKIKYFIENKNGTAILDLSAESLTPTSANSIYPYLTLSSATVELNSWIYNVDNIFINEQKTNAWPISDSIFESVNNQTFYGIYGSSIYSSSGTKKQYRHFTSTSIAASNIILKENTGGLNRPLFISVEHVPQADSLVRGNILATTAPVMRYCNNLYNPSSIADSSQENSSSSMITETRVSPTSAIERTYEDIVQCSCRCGTFKNAVFKNNRP
jgi:hypothetical protein